MHRYNKYWRFKEYFLLLFTIIWACSPDSNSPESVLRYNQNGSLTSLDPAFARSQANNWLCRQLYNTLLDLDDSLHIVPALARHYEVSPDGLEYRFSIAQNVYFQDADCFPEGKGRRMIAQDIVYSFNRIIDSTIASPGSWIFLGKVADEQAFSAPNDSVFILRLKQPFRPILGILTMPYCSVLAHEAVEKYKADFRSKPVGTGAYKLVRWEDNQLLILRKNDHYWEAGLPKTEVLRVSFIKEKYSQFLSFKAGDLDFINSMDATVLRQLVTRKGELLRQHKDELQLERFGFLNTEYLGINLEKAARENSPLRLKKVRQALNYSINRPLLLQTLRYGIGQPASNGFVPKGLPSYTENLKGYNYQPELARKLLADAGFPSGKNFPKISLYTNSDYADICSFLAKEWEQIGIQVSIETMESGILREQMAKGDIAFFRASWIADYPDAESFLTCFYSKNPAPPNYTRFRVPAFDAAYEDALREEDAIKRMAIYRQADSLLIAEAPVIFLYYDEIARFSNPKLRGLSKNGMNLVGFKKVEKKLEDN